MILRILAVACIAPSLLSCKCLMGPPKVAADLPSLRSQFIETSVTLPTTGRTYPMDVTGSGRPVLLMHEVTGETPGALNLALELARRGCKVYVPRFYGKFGDESTALVLTAPFRGRWAMFSESGGSIRQDLKDLAAVVVRQNPGKPVTVIGNCMTGGIAFELLAQPGIETAVVSQPALPLLGKSNSIGIPETAVSATVEAMRKDHHKRLISFNYYGDRFALIRRQINLARYTTNAGLTNQHALYFGMKRNVTLKDGNEDWLRRLPGWHRIEITDECGHSTITGAIEPDLGRYRLALYQALGLPLR